MMKAFGNCNSYLADSVDELIVVDLPPEVFHLMGIISLIDNNLAVINPVLLPGKFREWLVARGFKLLDVPPPETKTLACNILTLAPRKCHSPIRKSANGEHVES